ncbi:MAG: hypothetical protein JWO36_3558 [Myxococcales bacterium]|nr:hypothetical protein [Myxococcales bacterium]
MSGLRLARHAALLIVLATSALATAAPDHVAPDHVAYVGRTLAAVRSLGAAGRDKLDRDLYAAARTKCHADTATATAPCLVEAARAVCAGVAACEAAADVIAANLRSVDDFVDETARVRLLRGATDYHAAVSAELRKRYSMLAAELVLAGGMANEAAAIDRMCSQRDRAVHACAAGDAACIPSLPWSRCVAAVVWFVGGTP